MSRIGKKPLDIPEKTTVTITEGVVVVKGPLGELKTDFDQNSVTIEVKENQVIVNPIKIENIKHRALWGTYASIIGNLIDGVNKEFSKTLILEGVGFRSEVKGNKLVLNLGFSHQVEVDIPSDIKVSVEGEKINVSGIDKHSVGQFSASLKALKKPEPYKGKGIRYEGEIIRRKEGKKAV